MTTAARWPSCRRRRTRRTRTPGSPRSRRLMAGDDYANIEVVDTVYGNDESEESYNQALALVDQYPDLELIMAPTTVGIAAAAKAMQDEGLCDQVKVSGLGLPDEMRRVHRERLRSGVRPVELRRPRLPHVLRDLRDRHRSDRSRRRGDVQRRADGHLHHRDRPDPRRRPARPDGTVLRLQRRQHRRRRRGSSRDGRSGRRHGHDGRCEEAAPATTAAAEEAPATTAAAEEAPATTAGG